MSRLRPLAARFYRRPADEVAPELLGRYLVRRLPGERRVARIVEVEAYLGATDRASHAWGGRRTERNGSLWLAGGRIYVFLVYGLHHCVNAVTGSAGEASAVLVRAVEPIEGTAAMAAARGLGRPPRPGDLGGGPGKLCQALEIDRALDGGTLLEGELTVTAGEPVAPGEVARGPRVGVDYAGDHAAWPLRFAVAGNRHVSRPRLGRGSAANRP